VLDGSIWRLHRAPWSPMKTVRRPEIWLGRVHVMGPCVCIAPAPTGMREVMRATGAP
jgi:hypothetical protein